MKMTINMRVFGILFCGAVVIFANAASAKGPIRDDAHRAPAASTIDSGDVSGKSTPKFPVARKVPRASELRRYLREQRAKTAKELTDTRSTDSEQVNGDFRPRLGIGPPCPGCDRSIPTRPEFQGMLRDAPADARQILERCKIDVGNISPLPQLPSGTRQLPVDHRQRAVGTWPR
jgi:hypothetical protein